MTGHQLTLQSLGVEQYKINYYISIENHAREAAVWAAME
jgi:hypothetical protein